MDTRAFEEAVLQALPELLEERLNARVHAVPQESPQPVDGEFEVELDGRHLRLAVEVKTRVDRRAVPRLLHRASAVRAGSPDAVFLVASRTLERGIREELAAAGVSYADLGGNLHLRAPGVFVRMDGGRPPGWVLEPRAKKRVNPFSDKGSFVLRLMLDEPERTWRVSSLAEGAALTKGWASLVAAEILERGYAVRKGAGLRLADPEAVLRDWAAAYSWRRNRVRSYVAPYEHGELADALPRALADAPGPTGLTLLAALDRIAPHVHHHGQTHLYVAPPDAGRTSRHLELALYLEPVSRGGNVHLVSPYYKASALFRSRSVQGAPLVSDVQLYLDLRDYPVRGREAARTLLRGVLAPRLGLGRDAVDRLAPE